MPSVVYRLSDEAIGAGDARTNALPQPPESSRTSTAGGQEPWEFSSALAQAAVPGQSQDTRLELAPSTPLRGLTFESIERRHGIRLPETEYTSLVEYVGYLLDRSRPARVSGWTDNPARYPRPARLVREPGLRILSLGF